MKSKFLLHLSAALLLVAPAARSAPDDSAPKNGRTHDTELPQISIIDKLLGIEAALSGTLKRNSEEQWAKDYQLLYEQYERDGRLQAIPGNGSKSITDALILGIKASDAVLALKARNVEGLNQAAEQIQQLAVKLGASSKELNKADTVKRYANSGRWLDAFMALGFLQRDVLSYLKENPEKKPQAVLVIIGGWLQGGRCVTHVIDQHYTPDVSNILREPRLVELMSKNVQELPPEVLSDPTVAKIAKLLPQIKAKVNVGLYAPVKQEDVKWLYHTFDDLVLEIAPEGAKAPAVDGKTSETSSTPAASPATPATAPMASPSTPVPAAAAPAATPEKINVAAPAAAVTPAPAAAKPWWKVW